VPAIVSSTRFNEIADEYDRQRPSYPDELVERACELAGLVPGDPVLEVGCGTGQLTRALLARGLHVAAVEPGGRLLELARHNLEDAGDVEFVHARLEDAPLGDGSFRAVFSASAFHWVDPEAGWRIAAEALGPGGLLALIQYFGLEGEHTADDQTAMLAAIERVAPDLAAQWPAYRDLGGTITGARERGANISEVWSWLGGHDLARAEAGELFGEVEIEAVPVPLEHTADELTALLSTMSHWARLSPEQREAMEAETAALEARLGRPIRSSTVACLAAARRR
jgi:SAM-dependent methyltransferase